MELFYIEYLGLPYLRQNVNNLAYSKQLSYSIKEVFDENLGGVKEVFWTKKLPLVLRCYVAEGQFVKSVPERVSVPDRADKGRMAGQG